jgi:hypothetical protein
MPVNSRGLLSALHHQPTQIQRDFFRCGEWRRPIQEYVRESKSHRNQLCKNRMDFAFGTRMQNMPIR